LPTSTTDSIGKGRDSNPPLLLPIPILRGGAIDIQSISVHIRYSRPLPDGSFKTAEIGAEGNLAPGEDWHEAQVALYKELGMQLKAMFNSNGSGRPQNGPETPVQTAPAPAPPPPDHWCETHHCEFKHYEKGNKSWYSHRIPDGGWCRET
jgi:hypothetical protein